MELTEKDRKFILEYIEYAYYCNESRCVGDIERKECKDEKDRALKIVNNLIEHLKTKDKR